MIAYVSKNTRMSASSALLGSAISRKVSRVSVLQACMAFSNSLLISSLRTPYRLDGFLKLIKSKSKFRNHQNSIRLKHTVKASQLITQPPYKITSETRAKLARYSTHGRIIWRRAIIIFIIVKVTLKTTRGHPRHCKLYRNQYCVTQWHTCGSSDMSFRNLC